MTWNRPQTTFTFWLKTFALSAYSKSSKHVKIYKNNQHYDDDPRTKDIGEHFDI